MKDTVLVTGAAGFIGSHFVDLLVREGLKPVVLDALTYAGRLENLAQVKEQIHFVQGRIEDSDLVARILCDFNVASVFNFAAESHVDRSIEGPMAFVQTNVSGTVSLLDACRRHLNEKPQKNFRFVQISTDEVYGDLGPTGHFIEASPLNPHSPYSASKAAADMFAQAWHHTYGLPVIVTRCSNNFGPRQYPEKLIPFMIKCAIEEKPLGIYGNGSNVRDWIYVEDHCDGIWRAYQQGRIGEVYCFGGNSERSNLELVTQLCDEMDIMAPRPNGRSYRELMTFVTDRLGHDRRYAIDSSKAAAELGFKPAKDFQESFRATIKWYLDNLKRGEDERHSIGRRERDTALSAH